MSEVTFKIITPHDLKSSGFHDPKANGFHEWFLPGAWGGEPAVERRDKAGRAQGNRDGYFPHWFILRCINPDCVGRAVVPVAFVLDHADACDPGCMP